MPIAINSSTLANSLFSAASGTNGTREQTFVTALRDAFGAANNVTIRFRTSGGTLLATQVMGPMTLDLSSNPKACVFGTPVSYTFASAGTIGRVEYLTSGGTLLLTATGAEATFTPNTISSTQTGVRFTTARFNSPVLDVTGGPQALTTPLISAFQGSVSSVGAVLQTTAATYQGDPPTTAIFPVQREFQWQRLNNGTWENLVGEIGPANTLSAAGTYRVVETAWRVGTESDTTVSASPSIFVTGTRDPELVYRDNLTWLGAFRLPDPPIADNLKFRFPANGLAFNPAGNGGLGSLFACAHPNSNGRVGEFTIPAPSTNSGSVPRAALIGSITDALEGQLTTSGLTGGTTIVIQGLQVVGSNLLISASNDYSVSQGGWIWQRPVNLATTGQVQGPFTLADVAPYSNPRWFTGYMAAVPSGLQSSLGGPLACGYVADSIVSNAQDGPSIASFDSASFSSLTSTVRRGTLQGATANTATLDAGASSTTNFYVGCFIAITAGQGFNDDHQVRRITAYNGTTKVATLNANWNTTPNNASSFLVVPAASSQLLTRYSDASPLQASIDGQVQSVWNWQSTVKGLVIPNGTRSVLCIGSGGNGIYYYGDPNNVNRIPRIYSTARGGVGEHAWPYTYRVYAYDAAELNLIRNGTNTRESARPYAVWNFRLPFAAGDDFNIVGATYDPATRRMFVHVTGAYAFGESAIHVFRVENAVAS